MGDSDLEIWVLIVLIGLRLVRRRCELKCESVRGMIFGNR